MIGFRFSNVFAAHIFVHCVAYWGLAFKRICFIEYILYILCEMEQSIFQHKAGFSGNPPTDSLHSNYTLNVNMHIVQPINGSLLWPFFIRCFVSLFFPSNTIALGYNFVCMSKRWCCNANATKHMFFIDMFIRGFIGLIIMDAVCIMHNTLVLFPVKVFGGFIFPHLFDFLVCVWRLLVLCYLHMCSTDTFNAIHNNKRRNVKYANDWTKIIPLKVIWSEHQTDCLHTITTATRKKCVNNQQHCISLFEDKMHQSQMYCMGRLHKNTINKVK